MCIHVYMCIRIVAHCFCDQRSAVFLLPPEAQNKKPWGRPSNEGLNRDQVHVAVSTKWGGDSSKGSYSAPSQEFGGGLV